MLEQAAAISVVHRFGRWMLAQLRAVDGKRLGRQPTHRRALYRRFQQTAESPPKIVDVLVRGRHQQRLVKAEPAVVLRRLAAFVDRQLQLLAVALDGAAEGDEAVEIELAVQRRAVGPHLGDDRAAGVGELHVEIALAIAVLAQLLLGEQRVALDRVPGFPGTDRGVSLMSRHDVSVPYYRLPRRRQNRAPISRAVVPAASPFQRSSAAVPAAPAISAPPPFQARRLRRGTHRAILA